MKVFKEYPIPISAGYEKAPNYGDQPDMFKLVNARPILCKDQVQLFWEFGLCLM
jgi:hypothetical protein